MTGRKVENFRDKDKIAELGVYIHHDPYLPFDTSVLSNLMLKMNLMSSLQIDILAIHCTKAEIFTYSTTSLHLHTSHNCPYIHYIA